MYDGVAPGTVALFSAPAPGSYQDGDATLTLAGGGALPDAFGMDLDTGDIDGDGLVDLAVGAPRDPGVSDYAGAVWVFYGASGVFAPP